MNKCTARCHQTLTVLDSCRQWLFSCFKPVLYRKKHSDMRRNKAWSERRPAPVGPWKGKGKGKADKGKSRRRSRAKVKTNSETKFAKRPNAFYKRGKTQTGHFPRDCPRKNTISVRTKERTMEERTKAKPKNKREGKFSRERKKRARGSFQNLQLQELGRDLERRRSMVSQRSVHDGGRLNNAFWKIRLRQFAAMKERLDLFCPRRNLRGFRAL